MPISSSLLTPVGPGSPLPSNPPRSARCCLREYPVNSAPMKQSYHQTRIDQVCDRAEPRDLDALHARQPSRSGSHLPRTLTARHASQRSPICPHTALQARHLQKMTTHPQSIIAHQKSAGWAWSCSNASLEKRSATTTCTPISATVPRYRSRTCRASLHDISR